MKYYYLNENKEPIETPFEEVLKKSKDWRPHTTVATTQIDAYLVSTVFLMFDHGHGLKAEPKFFETMIFDESGPSDEPSKVLNDYQTRCGTYDKALEQHMQGVAYLMAYLKRSIEKRKMHQAEYQ